MKQPNQMPAATSAWLKQFNRHTLHDEGWMSINYRYYNVVRAARPFMNMHFADPAEREAAFDGFTVALLTLGHFDDVAELQALLSADREDSPQE